ncbi:type II secretion system minor pseudopilin GspK [Shimia biformata]|uniref:type II secretion system minor pseudopilin GspK n=1 Tax=Shimia biformata TaxID=1294299 RepID=UPI00194F1861
MTPEDRGFVLVNALVLVAAMAAVAAVLLMRAETGRARLEAGQGAAQVAQYLGGAEALAVTLLDRDRAAGSLDHLGEAWAGADFNVALDRGRVAGTITDLQGLFNVNWLADPEDTDMQLAFDNLARRIGLAPARVTAIRAFLQPGGPHALGGPGARAAYAARTPPSDPVGGAILMLDQLAEVPGITPRDLERLRRVATALPGDSLLNVNTAPPEVLAAFLPGLGAARIDQLMQSRRTAPFPSGEAFADAAGLPGADREGEEETGGTGEADPGAPLITRARLAAGSEWFRLEAAAQLDHRRVARHLVLHRPPAPGRITVAWRISHAVGAQ